MLVNAQSKRYSPNLYQASLTDPIPGREYDLIICLFDSINYLKNLSEISQCLMEAEKALAPHGIFIFDISTLLNSMENFSDMVNHQHDKDTHLIHKAYYEPGQRRQISRLYLFKAQGAAYSLQTEEHHQRVFLTEELAKVIEDSPLKLLAIHSTDSKTNFYPKKLSGLDHRHYRLFFILGRA
jgi:SAM-dependent methyltransferase